MDDLFKKFLLTGVGIVSTTAETMQKSVDEWIEKGTLSSEEGRKVVEGIVEEANKRRGEVGDKVKNLVNQAKNQLDLPTREELESLNARIAELEAKLADRK